MASRTVGSNAAKAAILSLRGLRRRRIGHIGADHWEQAAAAAAAAVASAASVSVNGSAKRKKHLCANGSLNRNGNALKVNGNGKVNNPNNNGRKSLIEGMRPTQNQRRNIVQANGSVSVTDPLPAPANDDDKESHRSHRFSSDLVVVLDMDECLIHSQFLSSMDRYRQHESGRPTDFSPYAADEESSSIISSSVESFRMSLPDGDLVNVNKRPNLDVFLAEITKTYETHVFTAAMEVYAKPLLDALDPTGTMIQRRFYRECCKLNGELGVYVKDLQHMFQQDHPETSTNGHLSPFDEKRVVLVDNNPLSFLANPSNGILVSNFYDDPKDDTLFAVSELLAELDQEDDVRPLLDERFGLRDALKDVVRHGQLWR